MYQGYILYLVYISIIFEQAFAIFKFLKMVFIIGASLESQREEIITDR